MVLFEIIGVILVAINIYEPISNFAKAGINVPIIGFGAGLAKGAIKAAQEQGFIGVFNGELVEGSMTTSEVFTGTIKFSSSNLGNLPKTWARVSGPILAAHPAVFVICVNMEISKGPVACPLTAT